MAKILNDSELSRVSGGAEAPFIIYAILPGDTLSGIAMKFKTNVTKIMELNKDKITDPDQINVGDEILIPNTAENK